VLTVPSTFWPYLLSQGFRPVEVYEIEAFAGRSALYYSDQNITWGGHDYVGLAVQRTAIKQQLDFVVPDCEVTFSNVANTLQTHLYPTDTLTGARLTIRLLMRNASEVVDSASIVLFRGKIEPPTKITEEAFTLSVTGLLDGGTLQLPARRFALTCPWQYANGGAFDAAGDCPYQSSTTANGSGSGSTALTLTAASTFQNGDSIQIGGGAAVTIASGAGTTSVTLSAARTWANTDTVRYADCNRTRAACSKRAMLYRFGGFPAVSAVARFKTIEKGAVESNANPDKWKGKRRGDVNSLAFLTIFQAKSWADPTVSVPVLYGRRRIEPILIEFLKSIVGSTSYRCGFYAASEGEIEEITRYWVDDAMGTDKVASSVKVFGIYYRSGGPGTNDTETADEYEADAATQLRAQNVDYRSLAVIAYSGTSYVILLQKESEQVSSTPRFELQAKGVKIQKYTTAGATDGARVWSESPAWQFVDLCNSTKHGIALAATDHDFAVTRVEADYAATAIDGTEASALVAMAQASASTQCKITSNEGFIIGRVVNVNGTGNTVVDVINDNEITLGTAVTQSVGDIVIQRPVRFESHVYMDRASSATDWLRKFLLSCRGYVTYDNGKIQFRIERDTCKERLTDGGFETWASATDLTAGTETVSAGNTINREGTVKRTGTYALNLHRTATGNLNERVTLGTVEPGRWYRLYLYDRGGAAGLTNAAQIRIYNSTTAKYLNADGTTWQAGSTAAVSNTPANGAWTQREITFLADPAGAFTDTVYLYYVHNESSPVNGDVYFDDSSLRGPYAGDFRETTDAKTMGWTDGSFVWSLDRKDRETNRVVVAFDNESNRFGADEAQANDFTHQLTHQIKTLELHGACIADRDQASRIAAFHLAKRRTLGPGCEFVGTPAALAVQPGDVILVSATVPGWTCEEQRVIETNVLGLGDQDEHFVRVRTEDYSEAIYTDVGPAQINMTIRPSVDVNVTVTRNAGGVLGLSIAMSGDSNYSTVRYRVHMSDTSGFTPYAGTEIGRTASSTFTYTVPVGDLDAIRYLVVIAITDVGQFLSSELSTTIYRNENTVSGYSANYQFPSTMQNPDPTSSSGTYTGAIGNVNDTSDADCNTGFASATGGSKNNDDDSVRYHSFGAAGSKTGRPYVRAQRTVTGPQTYSHVSYYYTLDRTAGTITWVLWQTVTSSTITDYFGPELTGVDYTKFAIRCRTYCDNGGILDHDVTDTHYTVAFDEKA
jgi:phage-related protein